MSVKIVEIDGKRYINEEEILLEYKCINKLQILFFRLPIFLLMIYLFFRINKQLDTYTLVWYLSFILIFGALWSIKRDIQNFYYVGFYLTNNNFITFSGRVIPLKEIYFSLGVGSMGWGGLALSFYLKKNFIIHCIVKNNLDFKELLKVLFQISKNEQFKVSSITFDNNLFDYTKVNKEEKYKLIKEGK